MTPTLKLKRYKIIQKYKNEIEKLYLNLLKNQFIIRINTNLFKHINLKLIKTFFKFSLKNLTLIKELT